MHADRSNRLLLVEDDAELTELVAEALVDEGYVVDQAYDGQRGLIRLRSRAVPARALMLTALGTVGDRIAGLDAGADDYLVKPFDLDELSARIRALCRRSADSTEALRIGSGLLDLALRDVVLPEGARVALSAREFELLRVLAARPNNVHSRAELRRRVFDEAAAASIVDTYVYYLRRKLGRAVVRTVHGLGYRLGML